MVERIFVYKRHSRYFHGGGMSKAIWANSNQVIGAKVEDTIPVTKYPVPNIDSAHIYEHHKRHEQLHPSSQTQQHRGHHTRSLIFGHSPIPT